MIVAIVGNGPTAAGKGRYIDACDFVVRLKAFWMYGALNAGKRLNALCWYGVKSGWDNPPEFRDVEFWITQEPRLFRSECERNPGNERMERIVNAAQFNVIRWMPTELFCKSDAYIGRSPTTGFTAINMALHILQPREIQLFGFDATTRDGPNSDDARRRIPDEMYTEYHDMLAEKRVIAELFRGKWLGEPCKTTLVWHDMPEALCET
ncbi:MAG: hypothetical protein WDK95_14475 [Syntrophorhabdaceae bacterium]|jgi:hypothetical protein